MWVFISYTIIQIAFLGGEGGMPAACGNSQARDQTHAIAATRAAAVTMQDP